MSRLTTLGVDMQAVEVDIQRHQHTQAGVAVVVECSCRLCVYPVQRVGKRIGRSANIASRRTPSTTTYARRQSKANSHGLVSVCPSHNVSVATTGALTRPAYVPALPTTDNEYLSSYSLPH